MPVKQLFFESSMRFKKEAFLILNFLLITTYMLAEKMYLFSLLKTLYILKKEQHLENKFLNYVLGIGIHST